jgi:hypothetical protein
MQQIRFSFLRLLEGYWVWPFNYLGLLGIKFNCWMVIRERNRWNFLMDRSDAGTLSVLQRRALAKLEVRGHYTPAKLEDCMPTSLGNILLSAETGSKYIYGLDAVICWPSLWLLLPKETREDVAVSRQRLDTLVELFTWGLFFVIWAALWPGIVLISVARMLLAYFLATQAAMTYADLMEAAFDAHRFDLYDTLHWPLPAKSGQVEVALGEQLTTFLWRGYTEKPIKYHKPEN